MAPAPSVEAAEVEPVAVDRLQVGVYISLEGVSWLDHPFLFNHFRITSDEQIRMLRHMGVQQVAWVRPKSTQPPLAEDRAPESGDEGGGPSPEELAVMEEKMRRVAAFKERRQKVAQCERAFADTARAVSRVMQNLFARPVEASQEAVGLVENVVDSFMAISDVAIQLMGQFRQDEATTYHVLNVMILSLILGKRMKLTAEQMQHVGLGALFHDIGKAEVPRAILRKTEPLTRPEQAFYRAHVEYGVRMTQKLAALPAGVVAVIAQHHEAMDGSGFPAGLRGEQISIPARMIAIANGYDNLCNPVNPNQAVTPYEAMSHMFSRQRQRYDERLLKLFVTCMGVYPPGTLVELSDGSHGMTMSVNEKDLLRPSVMLHEPGVPREEALVADLARESELSIVRSLRPRDLAPDTLAYLNPRTNVRYYFQEAG